MVALNLLAASLLLAAGSGLGFANAGAAPVSDSSDQAVSSSDVEDRGVNPSSSHEVEEQSVEYPVVRDNDPSSIDFTGKVWLLNDELVFPETTQEVAVTFVSDDLSFTRLYVQAGPQAITYKNPNTSNVVPWTPSDGWSDVAYRTLYFESNIPTGSVRDFILSNGSEVVPTLGEVIVDAIEAGLAVVGSLGVALVDGFDAVFMDDGALTAVGSFAFILMGIGISVGITKKCFNWVTGRHGM